MRAADHAKVWAIVAASLEADIPIAQETDDDAMSKAIAISGLALLSRFAGTIAQAYREEAERNPE